MLNELRAALSERAKELEQVSLVVHNEQLINDTLVGKQSGGR